MSYVYTPKYFVYLLKDGQRKKKLYSSATYNMAKSKYNAFLKKDKPFFSKKMATGKYVNYEISILTTKDVEPPELYKKDELGRNIFVNPYIDQYTLLNLNQYEIPEKIYNYQTKKFIYGDDLYQYITTFKDFIQVFTLNTFLFVQDEDKIYGFGLKSKHDSKRLIRAIEKKVINEGRMNIMCVRDRSIRQRKNLYDMLETNGFKRSQLYKHYSY